MRQRRSNTWPRRRFNQLIIPANRYLIEPWFPRADPIWLVGDGRSGTTWVSNIINYKNQYRYLFEPFHPDYVDKTRPFRIFQYLRQDDLGLLPIAQQVFSGRLQHCRVDKHTRGLVFRGLLVKDIFAHLFMNWIDFHLPSVRKIFLMRHPFAVALSKLEHQGWRWMQDPTDLLDQRPLREDFLEPYVKLISRTKGEFERMVLIWAIIHFIPFKQSFSKLPLLVFYEELRLEPDVQVRRIREFVGDSAASKPLDHRIRDSLDRPSQTSDNSESRNTRKVDDWRTRLSSRQIATGVAILREFGLDGVYADDPMPASREAAQLLER